MSNIYDDFRGVRAIKASCDNERSAAFITEGFVSHDITHIRLDKTIKAAVTFDDEEGPDSAMIFTLQTENLIKGDYFTLEGNTYFIYEDVKLFDSSIPWKKQKALECNISFSISETTVEAYFLSSLRAEEFNQLEINIATVPEQTALLVVPSRSDLLIGIELQIGEKGWKIIDYDKISNSGISYIYMQRASLDNTVDDTLEVYEQAPQTNDTLNPMVEYTFDTHNAYFDTDKPVNILQRTPTSVTFSVPFGIEQIRITTKDSELAEVENTYEVVE